MSLQGLVSSWSLADITPTNMKKFYLRGLEPLFREISGEVWNDEFFWWCLSQGVMMVEGRSSVALLPIQRVEFHDYNIRDNTTYLFMRLHKPPVYSISRVSVVYPITVSDATGNTSTFKYTQGGVDGIKPQEDNVIYEVPMDWIRLERSGQLIIVPTLGIAQQQYFSEGGSYFPLSTGFPEHLPHMFRVEYIGGFHNTEVPMMVVDAIFKAASIEALTVLSDTLRPPGVTSMELDFDGVRRSYTLDAGKDSVAALFSARISQYRRDLFGVANASTFSHRGGLIAQIRDRYQGFSMEMV